MYSRELLQPLSTELSITPVNRINFPCSSLVLVIITPSSRGLFSVGFIGGMSRSQTKGCFASQPKTIHIVANAGHIIAISFLIAFEALMSFFH